MSLAPAEAARDGQGAEVLVVCADAGEVGSLLNALDGTPWRPRLTNSCRQAMAAIQERRFAAVVCGAELPDGTWKEVLAGLRAQWPATRLMVFSRFADETLWADVLHLGGHDVWEVPFDSGQVLRALHGARSSVPNGNGRTPGDAGDEFGDRLAEFEAKVRQAGADLELIGRKLLPGSAASRGES